MIIFNDVTKEFSESDYGLQAVNFSIEPGELVFITGNSGSGKTTLMRLLTKEYLPTSGEIHFNDEPLSEVTSSNIHLLRRKIGVVFQDYKLLPEMNVWENISLPLYIIGTPESEIERRVTDLLQLVSLENKADLFPSQLSGGEAQRVSIARALTTGPSVIFADEPTGNLDPETGLSIASLLHKINQLGTTLLFATHNLDFIERFKGSRHIHLENGKLVLDTKKKKKPEPEAKPKQTDAAKSVPSTRKTSVKDKAQETETLSEAEDIAQQTKAKEKSGFFGKLFGKNKKKSETKPDETEISDESNTI